MLKKTILILSLVAINCTSEDEIMKHPLDKSEVRTLVLENGIRVYLLSDPKFNVSAASISVEVGSLQDPDAREGLAHFLEHMLFLGTEKYPDVDEYSTYLKTYGGYSNAYTAGDHTNYQFQVLPDGYEGALDRFAQFFISPLFTDEYTAREVNAVNSEYQKNIMNDGWRQFRISSQFAKDGHPQRKFNIGNLETLGDVDRNELIDFYTKHYSANRMGLALLSTHTLDEMEGWAREHFSSVKNFNLERNNHDPIVFDKKETAGIVQIEPVKDLRNMQIMFALPSTRNMYKSKPGRQFGFILGHEGKGSLLSYLKNKGWALSLSAGARPETKEYGYASIRIGLTEKGLKEYKDVVRATTDYIHLMKNNGHQKHVFTELKSMSDLDEIYSSKGEGMWRATQLANETMMYPLEDAGRINYIYSDSSPNSYENFLSNITADNMLILLIAKGVFTDQKEHYFQIDYSYNEDETFYNELLTPSNREEFKIPKKNPFIPKTASVPNRELAENVFPEVVYNENGVKLYFGKDHEFLRPKGVIGFKILFPKETMSVKHRVYSRLYVACVNESLNELSYPAKLAGLNYSIREGYEGIYIDVNGYKESAMALFELLLDHIVDFSITENKFLAIKDKVVRDYKNFSLSDAHQQTREKAPDILYHVKYTWEESLPVAESASLNDIKDYSKSLYEKTYTEAMVYGDFDKTDAEKTARLFRQKTKTKGINREEAFDLKYLKLDEPEIIQYTDNLLVNNSCFFRQYVLGEDSPQIRAVSKIISKALQQPFFTEMRTNQQLGYIVWSYTNNLDETHYLNFLIQSGEYPADKLNRHADEFIISSSEIVNSMDSETFQQLVDSVIEELEKTPMSIAERARKLKTYIFEYDADYLRDQDTIESLRTIEKETVANLLDTTVSPKSRRMVNVLTFAENHDNITKVKSSFSNLDTWKASRVYE